MCVASCFHVGICIGRLRVVFAAGVDGADYSVIMGKVKELLEKYAVFGVERSIHCTMYVRGGCVQKMRAV
jgi:hypothetical protein